ncbi:MAG: NAD+ synthase [Actinobacteria bacterium]|nr:NAD+ synthase [Actinomycetota bacterium]
MSAEFEGAAPPFSRGDAWVASLLVTVGKTSGVRIALAQVNPTVGDISGNAARAGDLYARAEGEGCDVVVFPELMLVGYPPEDLVLKRRFVEDNVLAVHRFAEKTRDCRAIIGFVDFDGDHIYNAAALCANGGIEAVYRKRLLPNYAVFDEERYFTPGPGAGDHGVFNLGESVCAMSICEDIWATDGPVTKQVAAGARIVLSLNGSPFHSGKHGEREAMLIERARANSCAIVYVNQVGGQDELVFDGASLVIDSSGRVVARGKPFEEDFLVVDLEVDGRSQLPTASTQTSDDIDRMYRALVLGTRDYVRKNGFTDVLIGLSGGIDSTLVACIAVEALGAEHVHGVAMPSRYSSQGSLDDAEALAVNLGIDYRVVPIEEAFTSYLSMLAPSFSGREPDLTEENLQSRCRGATLMALSNKFNWMVLTTGNKSEMAVGYFTIYGDSVGGYAVIKDVLKTEVYALCRRVNERAGRDIIPESVLVKPPSAELRPDQRDDQSLPPYEVLDPIVRLYVDGDLTVSEIVTRGFDESVVRRIARLIDLNEYKRRQCAPGVRVSTKAFGKDRRMPITSRYSHPSA